MLLQMGACKHVFMSVQVLYRGCFKWPSYVKHCPLQRIDLKNATPHNNLKSLLKAIMSWTPQALGSQWCVPDLSADVNNVVFISLPSLSLHSEFLLKHL